RLIRVSFGPFMLGDLEPGQIEEVRTAVFKDQLGPRPFSPVGGKRELVRRGKPPLPRGTKTVFFRPQTRAQRGEQRPEPETRPPKRRRILEEGGTGRPKIEFVAEARPRRRHFDQEDAGPGRKPRSAGRSLDHEDGRKERAHRFEKTARSSRPNEARRKPSN